MHTIGMANIIREIVTIRKTSLQSGLLSSDDKDRSLCYQSYEVISMKVLV